MSASLPRRLRSLLGADIEDLTEAHLQGLIGQPETDDLEVKAEVYGRGDSAKRELCADMTALANARGGLLLIGASESDDVVDELTPVETDGQEIWIRQVLASGIVPPLPVLSRTIPASSADGTGYIAVAVAASVDAPHAAILNDDFRYVVRDGPRKRPMREPEVADQHRRRVVAVSARNERLADVHDSIVAHVEPSASPTWLVLASVPDSPGRFDISSRTRDETRDWIRALRPLLPIPNALSSLDGSYVSTGFRRVILGDSSMFNGEAPGYGIAEFHTDGSVGVAIAMGGKRPHPQSDDEAISIPDIVVPFYVIAELVLAGRWAERVGAGGQINVSGVLRNREAAVLVQNRRGFLDRLHGTRSLTGMTPTSTHTFGAEDLCSPGPGLVASAALISNDIFNSFGAGQCLHLAPSGAIRQSYVDNDYRRPVSEWAERNGVELSAETIA